MSSVVSWSRSVWSAPYSGALKGRLARFAAKAPEWNAQNAAETATRLTGEAYTALKTALIG